jgi:hypothetical protein
LKKVAAGTALRKDSSVPVKDVSPSQRSPFNPLNLDGCGVLIREGIFYASLKMRGQDAPLLVALHGVRSEQEAREAFAALITLRQADCGCSVRPSV